MIAATAQVHDATFLTHTLADSRHVADIVRVLHPSEVARIISLPPARLAG